MSAGGARTMKLEVITPQRVVYSGEVTSVSVPGVLGYIGFMPGHVPYVVAVQPGVLSFRPAGGPATRAGVDSDARLVEKAGVAAGARPTAPEAGPRRMAVTEGFAVAGAEKVTLLVDAAELSESIDVARAQAARERALSRLNSRAADVDLMRAKAALRRAMVRLKAAEADRDAGTVWKDAEDQQ